MGRTPRGAGDETPMTPGRYLAGLASDVGNAIHRNMRGHVIRAALREYLHKMKGGSMIRRYLDCSSWSEAAWNLVTSFSIGITLAALQSAWLNKSLPEQHIMLMLGSIGALTTLVTPLANAPTRPCCC